MSVRSVESKSSIMTTVRNLCSLRYIHVLISLTHSRNLICNTLSVASLFNIRHMYTIQRRLNLRSYTRLFTEEVASDIHALPETN